jgi:cell division septal protein FtsQ
MGNRDYFRQTQRASYDSRSYRNPHLRGERTIPWKRISVCIGACVIIVVMTTLMLGHSVFQIQHIEITGRQTIDRSILEESIRQSLEENAFFFFHRSNQFLFSSEQLASMLEQTFALATVTIGIQERNVFIQLEERTSNLIWQTQNQQYVVDLEGIVVRAIPDEEHTTAPQSTKQLPLFIDLNNVPVDIGSQVLSVLEIENALQFYTRLEEAEIKSIQTELDRLAGKWAKVQTEQGFDILIDLAGDIELQYSNLVTLLKDQIPNPSELDYIDLRFGDKVYFK